MAFSFEELRVGLVPDSLIGKSDESTEIWSLLLCLFTRVLLRGVSCSDQLESHLVTGAYAGLGLPFSLVSACPFPMTTCEIFKISLTFIGHQRLSS